MIIIANPHFSQYRVSRDSLPTQSSNLVWGASCKKILNGIYWFLIKRAHHRTLLEGIWQQIWFFLCWFWHLCINLLLMFRWFFLLQENMIWTFLIILGTYFVHDISYRPRDIPMEDYFSRYRFFSTIGIGCRF